MKNIKMRVKSILTHLRHLCSQWFMTIVTNLIHDFNIIHFFGKLDKSGDNM